MTTREQEILDKTVSVLKGHVNPQKIYLFGSRAEQKHREGSDFDFAVTGKEPDSKICQSINEALEQFVGLYHIDIVYLENVDVDLRELILNQGRIVYEK